MCGIVGFWLSSSSSFDNIQNLIDPMIQSLEHRGPDANGLWINQSSNVALGHRRLSILDLSSTGSQPMESSNGRYVLSYNGEIYNHLEIRRDIQNLNPDYRWRGSSDTETILAAIEIFGIEKMLDLCSGMFAMAIWDSKSNKLTLTRDRFGEKPLYYYANEGNIMFASELKALRVNSLYKFKIDPKGVKNYFKRGYLDEMHCIDSQSKKVPPGKILCFDNSFSAPRKKTYWSYSNYINSKASKSHNISSLKDEAIRIEAILSETVKSQMISDVPIGSFLSGGIDSSLITALMQKDSNLPVKTFTVGFEEDIFNESKHAEKIADYLGTDHTSFILKESDALDIIPKLPIIYDEPFADYSQIPSILLAREAKKHVSVVLTGDGGDEIFGGYNRHVLAPMLWSISKIFPTVIKKEIFSFLSHYKNQKKVESSFLQSLFLKFGLSPQLLLKVSHLSEMLSNSNSYEELYDQLTSIFLDSNNLLHKQYRFKDNYFPTDIEIGALSKSRWIMLMDSLMYLPGDILTKVDRASMSTSLETRAPFLDRRVAEIASGIKTKHLIKRRKGKFILRHILSKYVPNQLFERPKQGFTIPLDSWLRNELRDWAEDLLSVKKIKKINIFEVKVVRSIWDDHLNHHSNNAAKLWTILMFQSWLERSLNQGLDIHK